jgi:hypothetical protein
MTIKSRFLNIKPIKFYIKGKKFFSDPYYLDGQRKNHQEKSKSPSRTEIINFLLSLNKEDTNYLEIGVRNPEHNYKHIVLILVLSLKKTLLTSK